MFIQQLKMFQQRLTKSVMSENKRLLLPQPSLLGLALAVAHFTVCGLNMEGLLRRNLSGLLVEMFTLYSLQSHNGESARFQMTSLFPSLASV